MSEIEIIEAAPLTALTTLATFKATLGISSDSYDDIITDMIQGASDFISNYCGRTFAYQTVKEKLPGKGVPDILLSITPIIEVTTVAYDGSEIDSSEWKILDSEAGIIQRYPNFTSTSIPFNTIDRAPSSYYKNLWEITYTGGYILPGYPSSAYGSRTLPYDLERAAIDLVRSYFLSRNIDGSIKSYKIGDTMVTWGGNTGSRGVGGSSGTMPASTKQVLDYYSRAF